MLVFLPLSVTFFFKGELRFLVKEVLPQIAKIRNDVLLGANTSVFEANTAVFEANTVEFGGNTVIFTRTNNNQALCIN